jgi:hypothetical protein
MSVRDEIGEELRALRAAEKQAGARLQLRAYTNPTPSLPMSASGPLSLTGTDSRGRKVRAAGTEEFLCKLLRGFPALESATA